MGKQKALNNAIECKAIAEEMYTDLLIELHELKELNSNFMAFIVEAQNLNPWLDKLFEHMIGKTIEEVLKND